jgi:hypothetical protein
VQGNYDNFKEQEAVKQHQQQKLWEKQEKKLREMKGKGVSKENAEKAQLKAKAREPGKIFSAFLLFPFFLTSFLIHFRVFPLPDFFLYPFPCDLYSYHITFHLVTSHQIT